MRASLYTHFGYEMLRFAQHDKLFFSVDRFQRVLVLFEGIVHDLFDDPAEVGEGHVLGEGDYHQF